MAAPTEFHTTWRKSSYSGNDINCVEVAHSAELVGVRDSKQPGGPVLVFSQESWLVLTAHSTASTSDNS